MAVNALFPSAALDAGMYESFYLRAASPTEPIGVWLRYTIHKRPGAPPRGSLWCTVFDADRGAPFTHKLTVEHPSAPANAWIQIGSESRLGPEEAVGVCGPARWSLRFRAHDEELRHLERSWMYRAPLPRTKLTSPAPSASFDGSIELPHGTIELCGWHGMVGHNWGAEHAERWIWLHGIDFQEDARAWIDVALGRVLLAGRLTPWLASGAISLDGRITRIGGLAARGLRVAERPGRCTLTLPGRDGLSVEAHVDSPADSIAGWRYADPDGGEHDVANCSIASLALNVRQRDGASHTLHTAHGGVYELGMRERDHGVPIAPFPDG